MRKKIVAGNWKMNKLSHEAILLADSIFLIYNRFFTYQKKQIMLLLPHRIALLLKPVLLLVKCLLK
jgi:hypothetical protein